MDPRTLRHVLRIEGLIPFTGCAILIGFVVTLWETGFAAADWTLFVIAVIAALLVHIDAHIWNDIMDFDIDRQEKSRETGRDRPLVFGWATVRDYHRMSAVVTVLVGDTRGVPDDLPDIYSVTVSYSVSFSITGIITPASRSATSRSPSGTSFPGWSWG